MEKLQYPIGRFTPDKDITPQKRASWIRDIENLPRELRRAVEGLTPRSLIPRTATEAGPSASLLTTSRTAT